ncbi:PREDICTED: uncharacterized protein LOC109189058 [Ipomoea nil]|uniref:uncharacterized protein LOC109189058 n=1 Tax=Ipomoea nil TaxID=35883 RepID=UPI000901EC90|nr:PREDICTED: uncharacterized protein LOC109189058 [Ipomoea nil]XP_019195312.1 PREDICTED: uncharacterized protein LOC109189058 [Ipomoea nil]
MDCGKAPIDVRKVKKKQVKDELDRIKQAEKKKRRLEKALATSAAIRLELEKKKQKKKEEQQRLDEEGAAIAEAVALHVLIGEDSEDSNEVMQKKDMGGLDLWDHSRNFDIIVGGTGAVFPQRDLSKCSFEGSMWISGDQRYGCTWNDFGNTECMVSPEQVLHPQFLDKGNWDITPLSPSSFAEAISSLQIAEDAPAHTYIFNRMLRESN